MRAWVVLSSALVASSKSRILGLLTMALAISILCFCPKEIVPAPYQDGVKGIQDGQIIG